MSYSQSRQSILELINNGTGYEDPFHIEHTDEGEMHAFLRLFAGFPSVDGHEIQPRSHGVARNWYSINTMYLT
ncbi:hypothetical protein OCU04_003388 [Sclerotinia nivalis]|uniref:Uncharacterized protein n=1 Tax=Sclerotinia nivalis TaxID=352851 RepID=A0A9X0ART5_9HELO|nr:hypothetical protein OCU04_003388 [Sclerotinia nivalis]